MPAVASFFARHTALDAVSFRLLGERRLQYKEKLASTTIGIMKSFGDLPCICNPAVAPKDLFVKYGLLIGAKETSALCFV